MLESLLKSREEEHARVKYIKRYPFNTSVDKENTQNDFICVVDLGTNWGFNVYEHGEERLMIKWFNKIDEAIEFAVDHARDRVLNHQS